MKLSKFEWGMIAGILSGAILIAVLGQMAINEIKDVGLKGIVEEIWCGENGCN